MGSVARPDPSSPISPNSTDMLLIPSKPSPTYAILIGGRSTENNRPSGSSTVHSEIPASVHRNVSD